MAEWITIEPSPGALHPSPLRCWWEPAAKTPRGGVLVLPEVFGINSWLRSTAARLAQQGYAALAVPLMARTAPDLDLGYSAAELAIGRTHKDRVRTDQLLGDLQAAATWLQQRLPGRPGLGCVGFCFGGHAALLAASLPAVRATAAFYGAGVVSGRPGGGPPSLEVLPNVAGALTFFCGRLDPLIPPADVEAIATALAAADPSGQRLRLEMAEAGHGYMCEQRSDYRSAAAAEGWRRMLELFAGELEPG